MTSGKIRVCILEGHQAELASAGLPFSVCLRLQELGLSMSAAQCSTRQTNTGFSVSIFWPSSTNVRGGTIVDQQKPRSRKRRRRKRKREPNARTVSAVRDVSPAQDPQNPCSAAASPINAHQPSLSPPPLAATDSSKLPSTTLTKMPNTTDSAATLNTSNSSSISSGSTEAEDSSMSPSSAEGSGWTVVSPRRRFRGPRVPAPYFRMPSHLWPPEIQKKYLLTTPSSSPVASRTRAKTSTT